MTEKKARSAFIPVLMLAMVLLMVLVFSVLVPVRNCQTCILQGWSLNKPCSECSGEGKVPLLNIWRRE